jgi:hypothetical protein
MYASEQLCVLFTKLKSTNKITKTVMRNYGRLIGKVLYCYVLPAMGTLLLVMSMFHRELEPTLHMSSESDTMLKVISLILCASTYWAAFMYWNAFIREYDMPEDKYVEYFDSILNEPDLSEPLIDEMKDEFHYSDPKVELDSPIKGLCLPFVREYLKEESRYGQCGWGNGYVLISSDHPMSGVHYDQAPYFEAELTFGGQFSTEMLELCGIDKDIAKDADKYWVFGFDTMHVWNNRVKNNENWVRSKAVELAADFNKLYAGEVV